MLQRSKATPRPAEAHRSNDSHVAERFSPRDVRVRRELTHRRLVVSMVRRFLRVVSLHVVDGSLVAGAVLLLAGQGSAFGEAQPYSPVIVAIFLLSLNALSAYSPGDARRDRRRLLSAVSLGLLILACLAAFPPRIPLSPSFLLLLGATVFLTLAIGRQLVDQLVRQAYKRGFGLRRAIMIGDLNEVSRAIAGMRDDRNIDQYLVGHLCPEGEADPTALGRLSELPRLLIEMDVQEVILTTSLAADDMRSLAECCFEHGATLLVLPSVITAMEYRVEPWQVGACPMLRLHPTHLKFPALLVKRAFDLVFSAVALVVGAPLMLLIAAAIKLDSPGPALYRARRIGLGGREFQMWKFRSMYKDAEQREKELEHLNIYPGGTFKVPNDPRITRVGRILRRTSLDELPQLFNVLRGEMSLVGPRPALVGDIARYEPHHFERLSVIPGITGPWQVGGRNLITDFETIVRMEQAYIRAWSPLLDLKILLRTLKVVWTGEGAF